MKNTVLISLLLANTVYSAPTVSQAFHLMVKSSSTLQRQFVVPIYEGYGVNYGFAYPDAGGTYVIDGGVLVYLGAPNATYASTGLYSSVSNVNVLYFVTAQKSTEGYQGGYAFNSNQFLTLNGADSWMACNVSDPQKNPYPVIGSSSTTIPMPDGCESVQLYRSVLPRINQ